MPGKVQKKTMGIARGSSQRQDKMQQRRAMAKDAGARWPSMTAETQ